MKIICILPTPVYFFRFFHLLFLRLLPLDRRTMWFTKKDAYCSGKSLIEISRIILISEEKISYLTKRSWQIYGLLELTPLQKRVINNILLTSMTSNGWGCYCGAHPPRIKLVNILVFLRRCNWNTTVLQDIISRWGKFISLTFPYVSSLFIHNKYVFMT